MFTHRKTRNESPVRGLFERQAFTLLELLLAVSLLAVITTVTYMTFSTALTAWKKATAMTDNMHHGDYVMEQLIMAVRSMYYPEAGDKTTQYGFWHEDSGTDAESSDVISWVKLGSAFVGGESALAGSPHRVQFFVTDNEKEEKVVKVRAWRLLGQPDDFDPEEVEPFSISRRVTGFNCRAAYRVVDDEIEWLDMWEQTNRIPTVLEVTIYLEPPEDGGDPIELKRIVGIPASPASWNR